MTCAPRQRRRRRPYRRTVANQDRVAQSAWTALRLLGCCTRAELAETAQISPDTAKHLLRRWRKEGLVTKEGDVGGGEAGRFPATLWRLAHDIGPCAPILHGVRDRDVGFTDVNSGDGA